jgi:hypothetical protein
MDDERPVTQIPARIRALIQDMQQATGHEADVENLTGSKWRVTLQNARVRLTMDYALDGRGRLKGHSGSTLQVDGKDRPLAKNFDHFVTIFKDPDSEQQVLAELAPMPPVRSPDEAPAELLVVYQALTNRLATLGPDAVATLQLGFDGRRWVIGLGDANRGIRYFFEQHRKNRWRPAELRPLQVVVDGVDRTTEAEEKLTKAIALMTAASPGAAPTSDSIARAVPAPRSSTETRRGTVMRN